MNLTQITIRKNSYYGGLIFLLGLMSLVFFDANVYAQGAKEVPPIIDREVLFGDPEITGAQLSPDGKYISFLRPYNDVRNIWVKEIAQSFEEAIPVTESTERPLGGYFWSRDGKHILFTQDKDGDENFHVYALDPSKATKEQIPEAIDLTPVDGVRAYIYDVPRAKPDIMYVGLNDRDASWHDLYSVEIATGKRTLIKENTDNISGWNFDLEGNLRMASKMTDDGGSEILLVTDDGFKSCYTCSFEESCGPIRYHPDGKRVYFISNKGDKDLTEFLLLDPATGKTEFIESDPEKKADFANAYFSKVNHELIATIYNGDKVRKYFKDEAFAADFKLLEEKLPGVEINLGSSTTDEKLWIVYANSDVDPGAAYIFNRDTKALDFQYRPRPNLPSEHLSNMEAVRYKSLDGKEIPAYLTLPKGKEAKNLPVVLLIHGGPWARDSWGYNPFSQFLANRGYAVLQPNFRGSTGYGKEFLNSANGEWGDAMQDDITAGVNYLVDKGIADRSKVGIMGGSYGGYATLAGVAFTPDVYAAGVSIVGPSNLLTLLETIPPYWEAIRKVFHLRMGDPNTEEGKAKLMRQSPLNSADKIKAPLMVIQGANDPRVKQAESDQIVIAMRELKRPVEYLVAEDEGHGFAKPDNNMAMLAGVEKFLATHLGGRYQEEVPEDIAAILEKMTVDINTVELAEAVDASALNAPLPVAVSEPITGEFTYEITIKVAGQEIPMTATRAIANKEGNWVVTDEATTPGGKLIDIIELSAKELKPVNRKINQGPMTMSIDYSDDKVEGVMNMNGKETPMEAALDAPLFADGGGMDVAISNLDLAPGFESVIRTFDPQMQKVSVYQLSVKGEESVEVPAGKFDTYQVKLDVLEGGGGEQTLWICKDKPRCVVKSESSAPQMGGAMIYSELKEYK